MIKELHRVMLKENFQNSCFNVVVGSNTIPQYIHQVLLSVHFSPSIKMNSCVCVCVVYVVPVAMCISWDQRTLCVLFCRSLPYSLETGFLSKPGAKLWLSRPQDSSFLCFHDTGVMHMCMTISGIIHRNQRFELWSSRLSRKCSYPLLIVIL